VGDAAIELISYVGLLLALLLLFGPPRLSLWAPLPLSLWLIYVSLLNFGGFGSVQGRG